MGAGVRKAYKGLAGNFTGMESGTRAFPPTE